jgi:5'(3')-deoxyribonucleotidase
MRENRMNEDKLKTTKVYFDMDNTLVRFTDQVEKYCGMLGYGFDRKTYDITFDLSGYNLASFITDKEGNYTVGTDKATEIFMDMMELSDFWENAPAYPNIVRLAKVLCERSDLEVYIATKTVDERPKFKELKFRWLKKHLPFLWTPEHNEQLVYFREDKENLTPGIIFEDHPDHIARCRNKGFQCIKITQPYNREPRNPKVQDAIPSFGVPYLLKKFDQAQRAFFLVKECELPPV